MAAQREPPVAVLWDLEGERERRQAARWAEFRKILAKDLGPNSQDPPGLE